MRLCIRFFIFSVFSCLLYTGSVVAQSGGSRADLEKRRQNILEAIKITEQQLERTRKDKNVTLSALRALQNKLSERQKLINNINQEIQYLNSSIRQSSQEVNHLQQNLETLKIRYAQSIRYEYKNRSAYSFIAFIFSANDFNDALRRMKYLKRYRDYRKEQVMDIRRTQEKISEKLVLLNQEKQEKDKLLSTENHQKIAIQQESQEKDRIMQSLKGKEKELSNEIAKNQRSLKQLERTISNLIQKEIELAKKREEERKRQEERKKEEERKRQEALIAKHAPSKTTEQVQVVTGSGVKPAVPPTEKDLATPAPKASSPATSGSPAKTESPSPKPAAKPSYSLSLTPEVTALSNNFELNKGKLPWPVEKGFIAESFGRKKHPQYNIEIENSGIEIQTYADADARTVFDGEITNVFFVPGMGQCVLVTHGQFFTVYSRLKDVRVKKGDAVKRKQVIGQVTANDNGEYLMHFELWKVASNDQSFPQDPAVWIAR